MHNNKDFVLCPCGGNSWVVTYKRYKIYYIMINYYAKDKEWYKFIPFTSATEILKHNPERFPQINYCTDDPLRSDVALEHQYIINPLKLMGFRKQLSRVDLTENVKIDEVVIDEIRKRQNYIITTFDYDTISSILKEYGPQACFLRWGTKDRRSYTDVQEYATDVKRELESLKRLNDQMVNFYDAYDIPYKIFNVLDFNNYHQVGLDMPMWMKEDILTPSNLFNRHNFEKEDLDKCMSIGEDETQVSLI